MHLNYLNIFTDMADISPLPRISLYDISVVIGVHFSRKRFITVKVRSILLPVAGV